MMNSIFTEDSKILINFIKNKVNDYNKNDLNDLFNFLKNHKIKEIDNYSFSEENSSKKTTLISTFASKKIIKSSTSLRKNVKINMKIGNINIQLNIYHNNDDIMIETIKEYIQYIVSFSDSLKNIEINLYLSPIKKKINGQIPSKENVNSGSCYNYGNRSIINIWRKEELLKVLLHELIHSLCFDEYNDTVNIIGYYKERYNISSDIINTREAYTEIWANIINCYLVSKRFKETKKAFYELFYIEKEFSLFQANKIIYLSNLDSEKININKDTNVLAYYIIRMELYNNIKSFISFCKNKNRDWIKIINPVDFLLFLIDSRNFKKIKKNNKRFNRINKKGFVYRTMRMSSVELSI